MGCHALVSSRVASVHWRRPSLPTASSLRIASSQIVLGRAGRMKLLAASAGEPSPLASSGIQTAEFSPAHGRVRHGPHSRMRRTDLASPMPSTWVTPRKWSVVHDSEENGYSGLWASLSRKLPCSEG